MNLEIILKEKYNLIKQYDSSTIEYKVALNWFLYYLQKTPIFLISHHQDYPEALNKTLEYIAKNIRQKFSFRENYFLQDLKSWINGYLKWRIIDLYRNTPKEFSLDSYLFNTEQELTYMNLLTNTNVNPTTLTDLDLLEREDETQQIKKIIDYINTDHDNLLRQCHPQQYPHCNCQLLIQKLLLENNSKTKLADELNINYQTLAAHWLRKCIPLIKKLPLLVASQP